MMEKEILRNNPIEKEKIIIPENEYKITTSRSKGPGGQNVNARSTKVTLFWNVWQSRVLAPEQKQKVIKTYAKKFDKEGTLIIWSQNERSQEQNRQDVIAKLNRIINAALEPVKQRISTKPSRRAKEKRLEKKKRQSEKKKWRQKPDSY